MARRTNRRWSATLVVALAVLASSLVQPYEADAAKKARPKCLGKKATIVGNKKANVLKGTKKADVIVGLGGNDRINGRGGADRICAGGGKDKIFGGAGNDRMDGGKGVDECRQQAGTGPKKNCEGPKFQLTVSKAGSGSGTVTSSPPGIDCGLSCSLGVVEGNSVSLSAAASPGSTFAGWAGACAGTGSCTVLMGKAQSVIATFTANPAPPPPPSFALAITTSGSGSGTISSSPGGINCGSDCSEVYTQGTSVTLSVTPAAGSVFDGWSGACSGMGSCVLAMDAAKTVNAAFTKVSYNMHVDKVLVGSGASGTVTSAPTGINCGTDCDEIYDHGTAITLTATPGSGSVFSSWSGCDSGTGNPCSISLTSARTATATFVKIWDLSVTKDGGTGFGTVTSSPPGINCGATCSANFEENSPVTLTPMPISGSRFDSWNGCDSVTGNQCLVTISGSKSVNAVFIKIWNLTVSKDGSGSGTVTSSPSGIECGSTCTANFDQGTSVVLTGTAAAGSRFGSWSGCDSSSNNQCTVNMTSAKSVTATFVKVWDLTVNKTGTGTGTVQSSPSGINCGSTCTATFDQGVSVTLTAIADSGSVFTGWSGEGCSGTGNCIVTMDAAKSVTANFTPGRILTVTKSGTGGGAVTSNPSGIDCGSDCTETYLEGSSVTLTATPDGTSTFTGWNGGGCSGTGTCVVTMDAAKTVDAQFTRITYNLHVDRTLTGVGASGSVTSSSHPGTINCPTDCDEVFDSGTAVTLTATAGAGSRFGSWSGCDSTIGTQCFVTMSSAKTVTVAFVKVWDLTVSKDGGSGGGDGTVTSVPVGITCGSDCGETYDDGQTVVLTANASAGSRFGSWSGCDSVLGNECTVNMTSTRSVTANFVKQWTLSVNVTGALQGTVTSTTHPGTINCGSGNTDCQEVFDHGTAVTLERNGGGVFTGWSGGGCSGTGMTCSVTMNNDITVNAQWV